MTKAEQARVTAWRLKILRWAQDEPRQVARTTGSAELFEKAREQITEHFDARRIYKLPENPAPPK
jgi:hypothetical protein